MSASAPATHTPSSEEVVHPHDLVAGVPIKLPAAELRALSVLRPGRAAADIALEWAGIAGAIALSVWADHLLVTALAVVFIGARQQALTVLAHDAVHHRLLPGRLANDVVSELLLMWPMFFGKAGFGRFHGAHHRFTNVEGDGNRQLWRTHDAQGALLPAWTYPKSPGVLAATVLGRGLFAMGTYWILRGIIGTLVVRSSWGNATARTLYYAAGAAALTVFGGWTLFALYWVLPFVTWHMVIQNVRLIGEHSNIHSGDPAFAGTRTTLPTPLERLLILPRNIGYHIEHHWFPSVPYYNLPALHDRLMQEPRFREHAVVSPSVWATMRAVSRPVGGA